MNEKKDVEVLSDFDDLLEDTAPTEVAFEEQTEPTKVEVSTDIFGVDQPMAEPEVMNPVAPTEPVEVAPTIPEPVAPVYPESPVPTEPFVSQTELPREEEMPEAPMGGPSVEAVSPVAPVDVTGVEPVDEATVLADNGEEMSGLKEHPAAQINMMTEEQAPVQEQPTEKFEMEKSTKKNLIFIGIIGAILIVVILLLPFFIK